MMSQVGQFGNELFPLIEDQERNGVFHQTNTTQFSGEAFKRGQLGARFVGQSARRSIKSACGALILEFRKRSRDGSKILHCKN